MWATFLISPRSSGESSGPGRVKMSKTVNSSSVRFSRTCRCCSSVSVLLSATVHETAHQCSDFLGCRIQSISSSFSTKSIRVRFSRTSLSSCAANGYLELFKLDVLRVRFCKLFPKEFQSQFWLRSMTPRCCLSCVVRYEIHLRQWSHRANDLHP